ncbi:MAG: PhoPQ-activated protein PqaA family protein [Hyphomonadaceae bacterium]|nr:PhoPQ-activated protein PqaA family protein [Hyphomonadaceae bacterium]
MKPIRFLAASVAFALAASCVASAPGAPSAAQNPQNVLDSYIAKTDPSFAWKVEKTFAGPGYHGVVIDLTSQTWLTAAQTDRSVWKHWLTLTIPDQVSSNKAFLFIGGGSNGRAAPKGPSENMAKMAVDTNSVVAELGQVPNQPMHFSDSPNVDRTEDDIIAYLQARYDPVKNPEALVRLPMVKSGTSAMTAVQEFMATPDGGARKIDGFVVSGGSKRGWTSWLVGLEDKRVIGMIPIVINVLDIDATTKHHWMAMGYFSPALGDYVNHKLIPDQIGKPGLNAVNAIEDPLNYRGRPRMKIPKFIINAVGDEYFPPDNTKFSYHLLPAKKQLRMLPNSKHSTQGTDIGESMTAWYGAVINNKPIPEYSWTVREDGALVVKPGAKPSQVLLWQGTNPKARDFRVDSIGNAFTSSPLQAQPDGTYVANVDKPAAGFTAYFVEMTYPSGTKYPFKFTTEVYVKPDVLPYRWEDARPIMAPDNK